MELVEGDDLSQRIARGAIPIDEALPIATQIAKALEAAHEQGIIHRDLKPANIRVRADGTVKVLDFGLAKAMEPAAGVSPSTSMSPTITTPVMMTGAGMILGTAAYMSPEQARGKPVDKRADIWAFGAVLFEMLTSKRPFDGDTMSDTIAAVLKADPHWTALPPSTPESIRRLLRRCLAKDWKHRLESVADARLELADPAAFPLDAPTGHLIFFRDNALLASQFDVNQLALVGSPSRVLEDLVVDVRGAPVVALSAEGTLVYPPSGTATSRLTWVSRQGLEEPISETARPYANPRLSPDGKRVVVTTVGDLWLQDTLRATFTRLTSDTTAGNSFPVWTPDGARIIFRTSTGLHAIDADGSGRLQAIPRTSVNDYPNFVSPDGATLAMIRIGGTTSGDIFALSLRGDPQGRPVEQGIAYKGGPQISPDGRWLAYVSDESGAYQVYVRPFPGPNRRWSVSTEGGTQPRWNKNGKELFYRNGNKLLAVEVSAGQELGLSKPMLLFEQRYAFGVSLTTPNYDVAPDGNRFLMVKDESGSGRLNVIENWFEELKRLVPTK